LAATASAIRAFAVVPAASAACGSTTAGFWNKEKKESFRIKIFVEFVD